MAFTGLPIFPGLTLVGVVNQAVKEFAINLSMECINALQVIPEERLAWADICGVTAAVFEGKIPIDLTALDGFEPFEGQRFYKQVDVTALDVLVNAWQRNLEWDIRFNEAGALQVKGIYDNLTDKATAIINAARVQKARLAASVLLKGKTAATVYPGTSIPGAGKALFATDHLANPLVSDGRTFSNLFVNAGKFDPTAMAFTRTFMEIVPSPTSQSDTLGAQVTDIIGGSYMLEPFRQVALQSLYLQTTSNGAASGAVNIGAATTNIYAAGTTPCRFWIAPQLNADAAYAAGKQMWIAVSRSLPGARPIEMVAPTKDFTPRMQLLGDGTEEAIKTRKIRLISDLDAGAAAGLPHVIQRFEEGDASNRAAYAAYNPSP